jgi:hypothetical protein
MIEIEKIQESLTKIQKIYLSQQKELEKWAELINLVPYSYWKNHEENGVIIVDELETVVSYIKALQKEM